MNHQPPLLPGQAYPGGPMIGEIYAALEADQRRATQPAPARPAVQRPGTSVIYNLLLLK